MACCYLVGMDGIVVARSKREQHSLGERPEEDRGIESMTNAEMVFGIDLGTTYSCIAYVDEYGKAVVIPNVEGDRTTPSVVQFEGTNRVVGKEAKNNAVLYPDQVVEMVKRQMGTSDWVFTDEGTDYRPEEISSYILRKLANDAEQHLGRSVKEVVITCPAYFGIAQR